MGNKQPGFESWPLDISTKYLWLTDFPGVSDGKESSFNAGDLGAWRANREAWSQK